MRPPDNIAAVQTSFLLPVATAIAVLAFACGEAEEQLDQPDAASTSRTTVALGCEFIPGVDLGMSPPPESAPQIDCSPGTEEGYGALDFGGIQGRMAPVPPLPPDLVVVSDYYEFDLNAVEPAIAGLALPLTEEITDPSTVAFYSYVDGEWRRIADVRVVRGGRAEGELSSFPRNLAVLREAP